MNGLAEDLTAGQGAPTWTPEAGATNLADAFQDEARLLTDLIEVLCRQREAVASDDLGTVDETVFSAQRIFRTLGQARRRRRSLLQVVAGKGDVALRELNDVMGPAMTPPLRRAAETLHEKAVELSQELEVNRQVLNGAIRSGEELMLALCGDKKPEAPSVYGPTPAPGSRTGESGVIINRQI